MLLVSDTPGDVPQWVKGDDSDSDVEKLILAGRYLGQAIQHYGDINGPNFYPMLASWRELEQAWRAAGDYPYEAERLAEAIRDAASVVENNAHDEFLLNAARYAERVAKGSEVAYCDDRGCEYDPADNTYCPNGCDQEPPDQADLGER